MYFVFQFNKIVYQYFINYEHVMEYMIELTALLLLFSIVLPRVNHEDANKYFDRDKVKIQRKITIEFSFQ